MIKVYGLDKSEKRWELKLETSENYYLICQKKPSLQKILETLVKKIKRWKRHAIETNEQERLKQKDLAYT